MLSIVIDIKTIFKRFHHEILNRENPEVVRKDTLDNRNAILTPIELLIHV